MGLCVFDQNVKIVHAAFIDLGKEDRRPFHKQVDDLIEWLADELLEANVLAKTGVISELNCEMPEFFNNQRGFHTAAGGDLTQMSYCVGRVAGLGEHVLGAKFTPIPVTTWKGQLKKPIVIERIKARIDCSLLSKKLSHDWDAAGIGLFSKGKF